MHNTPASLTASAAACARAMVRSTGFSQKMALPAAAARTIRSACVSVLDATTTALMAGSASASSTPATDAPCSRASACADSAWTSTTYFNRTPGWRARFAA